jgi:thymidine kinase
MSQLTKLALKHPRRQNISTGEIQAILGPMFAGKSTELMRRVRRYRAANLNVFIIKSVEDKRSDDGKVETHNGDGEECNVKTKTVREAIELLCQHEKRGDVFEVVAIDEAEFFSDIIECANEIADSGRTVITAGCDSTFDGNPFGKYPEIASYAEDVVKLKAICKNCLGNASFTVLAHPETIKSGEGRDQEPRVGGAELYTPMCRPCRLEYRLQYPIVKE